MNDLFDSIYQSVVNGQYKRAIKLAEELDGYQLSQLIDFFAYDQGRQALALDFAKSWFRHSIKTKAKHYKAS